ncbi:ROK family transcriptional regulator [Natronogracilivirga saccharolytica]|uniref:ROK family transcriptional regulator n=1 Tax=Natronogracilivirga saccharolytica TaxID=2812953 RepID=A0A8J7RLH3_9BACT|nr:ROK family transcriptional regulator [Natronogracilivirga saccharolytica]MBP3192318.1 ROK family transcriptional regulator [Natronogracilivirga saccharolytica]
MLFGTNLQYANSYNNRIVLEMIRLYGPLSRMDIARKTHLTVQTVTNITKKLMSSGLVLEDSRHTGGRGAPALLLKINADAAYSIGIDFDKDHLTTVMLNLNGEIIYETSRELDFPSPEEAIDLMTDAVDKAVSYKKVSRKKVWGVGVGLPGPLNRPTGDGESQELFNPDALPGWHHAPVFKKLRERLNMPVIIENNASAAAIGEHWYGNGRGINSFFYLYFGAGLGGGLVIRGQLYSGHTGNAGELGYFPTSLQTGSDGSHEHDHLGGYFNMPKLKKKLSDAGHDAASQEDLAALFDEGNAIFMEWLDTGAGQLIPLLAAVEYLIDPEVIFLGGRLPENVLGWLKKRITDALPPHKIPRKLTRPELKIASSGIDAAALGVATLPLYTSLAPVPELLMKQETPHSDYFGPNPA